MYFNISLPSSFFILWSLQAICILFHFIYSHRSTTGRSPLTGEVRFWYWQPAEHLWAQLAADHRPRQWPSPIRQSRSEHWPSHKLDYHWSLCAGRRGVLTVGRSVPFLSNTETKKSPSSGSTFSSRQNISKVAATPKISKSEPQKTALSSSKLRHVRRQDF